jgi:hypothetical protein
MKTIPFALTFLILFSSLVIAQAITIGVHPSEVILDFYKSKDYNVELTFFNELGNTDAYYTLTPDECLSHLIKGYQKEVFVPKGTNRFNPVKTLISLEGDNTGNKTCYLRVSAKPAGANGTISIIPSMNVRFIIYQGTSKSILPPIAGIGIFVAVIIIIAIILIIKWRGWKNQYSSQPLGYPQELESI